MTEASRPRRIRMTGQERREQLLIVGRTVFAERGYEAAAIEEIADRANVSKPVVYAHFGGKEGLYAVIVDREVRDLIGRITKALESPHPRRAVEGAAEAFLTYIEEQQEGFRMLLRDGPIGTTSGTLPTVIADIATDAEALLARHFRARGYDAKMAPLYARALVGMVALVGQWWLDAGKPKREEVAAHLVNLAWNGLKDLDPKPARKRRADVAKAAKAAKAAT